MCNDSVDSGAGDVHRGDGHRGQSDDGHKGQSGDGHRGQASGLVRDRLLVAANAALASLAGNADTHFAMVNEGAAPALVAALQHGTFPLCLPACWLQVASLISNTDINVSMHPRFVDESTWFSIRLCEKDLKAKGQVSCTCLLVAASDISSWKQQS